MIEILMKDKTFKNYNLYNNVNWVFESRDPLGIGSVIYTVEAPEIIIIVSGEIESSNQMVLVNELLTHFNTELFYHKSIFKELLNKQILYYNIHGRIAIGFKGAESDCQMVLTCMRNVLRKVMHNSTMIPLTGILH